MRTPRKNFGQIIPAEVFDRYVCRTIDLDGCHTPVWLESEVWAALDQIALHESIEMSDLMNAMDSHDGLGPRVVPAVKCYLLNHSKRISGAGDDFMCMRPT